MWNLNKTKQSKTKIKLIDTENRLLVARGGESVVGEMDEKSQKVQSSSYKINKSWGCNVQHADYSW